jgi:hypothetical protein
MKSETTRRDHERRGGCYSTDLMNEEFALAQLMIRHLAGP